MVLAPLFWLQSMKTLPSRSERFMLLITRSGWSASSARASSRATAVACSVDCDPSSGAYRWMPLLPTGDRHRIVADVAQDVADQQRDLGAVGQADAPPGIEVEHQPVGVARLAVVAEAPLRHVDLQRGQLSQPGQRGQIVDHRVVVVVILVRDLVPGRPSPASRRPDPC